MSLTARSEVQVSTAVASSSPLTLPSSTSSPEASGATSILFICLVVFLSVVGTFTIGVIFCYFAEGGEFSDRSWRRLSRVGRRSRVLMWDVLVDLSTPQDGRHKWRTLHVSPTFCKLLTLSQLILALKPLTVQVDTFASAYTNADEPLGTAHHHLTSRFAMQLVRVICRPFALALPSDDAKRETPPLPNPKIFTSGTDAQIAILVAMPSSRCRPKILCGERR
jgi:hypothetical protein